MKVSNQDSQRHRFTLWLYDDSEIEAELADYLGGLDRYRRAEFLRNITKEGWLRSKQRSLAGTNKTKPRKARSKSSKVSHLVTSEIKPVENVPPQPTTAEPPINNETTSSLLFASPETTKQEASVTDPLAALMGL